MITLVTILHVLVCIFLILIILLQAGKGGGMGSAFGGAGAQTVFGGRGAQTFLGKVTSISAFIFMLTSLTLAYNSSKAKSVLDAHAAAEQTAPAPAAPLAPPIAPASGPASAPVPAPTTPAAPVTPAK